jgi:NAD(P)-dependent dehydrogenase (short-subunit alcohol dehydrogenase family)
MTYRLNDEHILITGGGSGIGAAIAEKALGEGARVSIIDVDAESGQALLHRLGGTDMLHVSRGDVCVVDQIEAAHAAAVAKFGTITGLVNNAGRNAYADPVTMMESEWDAFFALDLKAAWLCAKVVLPSMMAAKRGAILNITSIHADHTFPGYFPYAAAKSGLVGLTRSLALEVGPSQVRVNALSPGWTETALVRDYFERSGATTRQKVLDVQPLGRIATPAEIANCVAFLLSNEASFVTGAHWRVDGGLGARFPG